MSREPADSSAARRRAPRVLLAACIGLATAVGGAACSFINAFPDVVPLQGSGGSGGAGATTTSSSSSSSSSTVASSSGSSTVASSSSTSGSGTGGGDAGGDAGTRGIVVVAGRIVSGGIATTQRVFAVLDAQTGVELSRYDQLSIVAAAHDPATDLWYLFEADTLPPLSTQPIKLHVGTIDPADGAWEEQAVVSDKIPVIADAVDLGVLDQRVVYAAFDPTFDAGGIPPIGLGVVNTMNAPQVAVSGFGGFVSLANAAPDGGKVSFNGFVSTPTAGGGGQANLITETCPSMGDCTLTRYLVNVFGADSTTPSLQGDPGTSIPKAFNGISAAWGSRNGLYDMVVFPPEPLSADGGVADGGTAGEAIVETYSPTVAGLAGTVLTPFGINQVTGGEQFTGLAYADCSNVLMLAERNAQYLYAVTLPSQSQTTPAPTSPTPVNKTTSVIYFDPVTNNLLMPLQPAGAESTFSLLAWHLDTTASPPALSPLSSFTPPADLAIDVVAVRRPPGFTCPTGS